ncbi:MAG: helix-turn-helix domain-containing protein [Planctomycetes bacterium]|nr:helix-turn-helix domain-containing protein [Planctomycetota bacterium]
MASTPLSPEMLGARIRQTRIAQGLRLEDLASRAGFTKGFLSKIENGKASPPIATLLKLAAALGVDATDLLQDDAGGAHDDPHATVHVRPEDRLEIANAAAGPGYQYLSLAARRRLKMMEPFLITVRPEDVDREKTFQHPGEEFIFVVAGETEYRVGDETYHLKQGDSLYFDASKPHAPYPKDVPVTFVAIFCAPPAQQARAARRAAEAVAASEA